MSRIPALIAAFAVASGLGAAAWVVLAPDAGDDRFADCRTTRVISAEKIGAPFTLTAHTGARMTSAEVIDRPTLLYFGYTYCPDVCPVDTVRNADAVDILEDQGIALRPVFISIDPERDDVDSMALFVGNIHPRMIGLTGTEQEISAVAKAYRVYRSKQGDDPEDYLMDHSTHAYLTAPGEGVLEFYRRDATAQQVADSAACFIDKL